MDTSYIDIALKVLVLLTFVPVYYLGVWVRVQKDNRLMPNDKRLTSAEVVADSIAGLFEAMVAIALIFGVVFGSSAKTEQWQVVGQLLSAAFLAYRSGYSYQQSILGLNQAHQTPPAHSNPGGR